MSKIVFTLKNSRPYGAPKVVCRHAAALASRGHQVTVVVGEEAACESGSLESEMARSGIAVSNQPGLFDNGIGRGVMLVRSLLNELRPDIVISSQLRDTPPVMIAAGISKTPAIAVAQNPLRFPGQSIVGRLKSRVYLESINWNATHVIAVSDFVRDHLRAKCRVADQRIVTVQNGFDFGQFQSVDRSQSHNAIGNLGIGDSTFTIGCVGRIHPQKGLDVLVQAIAKIRAEQHHHDDLAIILVGDEGAGGRAYRSRLENLIRTIGLESQVHFVGFQKDPSQFLAGCDLFIQASRWEGGCPTLSCMEAWAIGVPTLQSDCSGFDHRFTVNEDGFGFKSECIDDLSKQLEKILTLPEERLKEVGRRGRKFLMEHFSWSDAEDQFADVVESVIA
ncbi:glycosyltransferase family 4 protein [Crateriforma conspicua]|uniref:MurG-like transferase n=1 Tax=Crateriforma conspicua TaxID=2527996 RepID=A0A5C5Y0D6_9PLAN|nr:glycosyltransferase family 4 protein [Crateriforma conspicua]QDV63122.1 MurG-like transferase [Crateriforma conspicua]TWT68111.1 MurG-like transferase [Crateriforma conspicua]